MTDGDPASDRMRRSWQRYWRVLRWLDRDASSPRDRYVDRILERIPGQSWLDAGCGRLSFPEWRARDEQQIGASGAMLFGCDSDRDALRNRHQHGSVCAATLEHLPFADCSFGFVSSNMVFEHLVQPEAVVRELARVAKPGGRILVHTVNAWHYVALVTRLTPIAFHRWVVSRIEGRAPEDVYPTQYRANTVGRLMQLFAEHDCRFVWGGAVADLPIHVPYRGLFWLALAAGMLERLFAKIPGLGTLARPNLLVEFQRAAEP